MDGQRKYEVIKKLAEENGSKERAALTLGITKRQVNRLLKAYAEQGKTAFVHGNRGRKPATTIPDDIKARIIDCYRNKYYDANFTHFTELLESHEHISVSARTVASILEKEYILSPKVTKAKKKRKSLVEQEVAAYITFFNTARPAYSLKYLTPQQYKEAYAPKDFAIGVSAGN